MWTQFIVLNNVVKRNLYNADNDKLWMSKISYPQNEIYNCKFLQCLKLMKKHFKKLYKIEYYNKLITNYYFNKH